MHIHLHLDIDIPEYDDGEPAERERYDEELEALGLDEDAIEALWYAGAPADEIRDAVEAGELVEHVRELYHLEISGSV